jgi:hypothetical protein
VLVITNGTPQTERGKMPDNYITLEDLKRASEAFDNAKIEPRYAYIKGKMYKLTSLPKPPWSEWTLVEF